MFAFPKFSIFKSEEVHTKYKQLLINVEKAKEEFAKIPRMKRHWKRKKKKIEKI